MYNRPEAKIRGKRRVSGIQNYGRKVVDMIIWLVPLIAIIMASCYSSWPIPEVPF